MKLFKVLTGVFLLSFMFLFIGCSNKPPKYNGGDVNNYAEKVGEYYGEKLKKAGAKNIRLYIKQSNEIMENFKQKIVNINDPKVATELVDNTIEKLLQLSEKYINMTEDDYKFLYNPLKYYGIYEDYDDLTRGKIIVFTNIILGQIFGYTMQESYGGKLYSPFDVIEELSKIYQIKLQNMRFVKKVLKNPKSKIYYYILTHSKYKDLFVKDDKFYKVYKDGNKILNIVNSIIKKNKIIPNDKCHNMKVFLNAVETVKKSINKDSYELMYDMLYLNDWGIRADDIKKCLSNNCKKDCLYVNRGLEDFIKYFK